MLDTILILFFWLCAEIAVRIRYRVKLVGLDEIIKKYGRKGTPRPRPTMTSGSSPPRTSPPP